MISIVIGSTRSSVLCLYYVKECQSNVFLTKNAFFQLRKSALKPYVEKKVKSVENAFFGQNAWHSNFFGYV